MNETLHWADLQDAGNAQAQLVLLAIARSADWKTGEGYPDIKTIAERAKCSPRTAWSYVKRLADDGFITRVPRKRSDGGRTSDLIILNGYSEWVQALTSGGNVSAPKAAKRYETPKQDLHGGSEDPHEFARPPMQACLQGPHATTVATPKNINLTSKFNVSAPERTRETPRAPVASKPATAIVLNQNDPTWSHWMTWLSDKDRRDLVNAAQEAGEMVVGSRFPQANSPWPKIDMQPAIERRKFGEVA